MPTRQPVTLKMVKKWNAVFRQIQQDLNECTCISALISFITYLYEVSIVTMTFKHSPGKVASYRGVTKYLPCRANTSALVVLRDKVTHELYDVDDIVAYTKRRIYDFGREIVIFCQNSASIGKLIFGMSFKRHF